MGFRVQGSGFRVWGLGFRVEGLGSYNLLPKGAHDFENSPCWSCAQMIWACPNKGSLINPFTIQIPLQVPPKRILQPTETLSGIPNGQYVHAVQVS